jgi:ribonuclease BN (tRNA processing enzyme)
MRFTVLGSSGGYPVPGAACSGYLVEDGGTRLWIDAGSGTFARLLEHCSPNELSAVLISHLHADHWTDLIVGLHSLRFAFERETPLPVYGPAGWTETMGVVAEWAREDEPAFVAGELRDGETIQAGSLSVEVIGVEHTEDMDTFGFRIANTGATLAYSADSGPNGALARVAREADLFVCEAGSPGEVEMHMHLNGRQAGEIAARAGVRRLLVTHLSPGTDRGETLERARSAFGGTVELAVEGHSVEVGRPG